MIKFLRLVISLILFCSLIHSVVSDLVDIGDRLEYIPVNDRTEERIKRPRDMSKMTFLIYAYVTRGDVQPMVQLARILKSHGHNTIIAVHPYYIIEYS